MRVERRGRRCERVVDPDLHPSGCPVVGVDEDVSLALVVSVDSWTGKSGRLAGLVNADAVEPPLVEQTQRSRENFVPPRTRESTRPCAALR